MFCRRFLVTAWLGALLYFWQVPVFGQPNRMTADQIVANYVLAIGGSDSIASITTFAEKGDLSGNLTSFGQPFAPPNMVKEKGTFEFYFKAPNLRSYLLHRENNTVVTMLRRHDCVVYRYRRRPARIQAPARKRVRMQERI